SGVAVENVVLAALLVVQHELNGDIGAAGPPRIRYRPAIALHVTRIVRHGSPRRKVRSPFAAILPIFFALLAMVAIVTEVRAMGSGGRAQGRGMVAESPPHRNSGSF